MKNSQIVIYQTPDGSTSEGVDVILEHDNVWLDQERISDLFQTDRTSITKHIKNIYKSRELEENSTCAKIAQVKTEGKTGFPTNCSL